jgi:hypothetical protein
MANTYVSFYIHHGLLCDPMHESWSRLCFLTAYIWVGIISCYLQVLTLVQSYLLSEFFRKFGGHLCEVTLRVLRGPPKIHQDVCADPDNFRAQNWWMYVSQSIQLCTPQEGNMDAASVAVFCKPIYCSVGNKIYKTTIIFNYSKSRGVTYWAERSGPLVVDIID